MKQKYIFHHDHYYHTLKGQGGEGIPVYHGVRQRGGGIGSVLGGIAKYALPLLMKYVFPHARNAALSTISDVAVNKESIKNSLKKNGIGFLKNVGAEVLNSVSNSQSGSGVQHRREAKPKLRRINKTAKRKNSAKVPSLLLFYFKN